jgi:hypothetical protein
MWLREFVLLGSSCTGGTSVSAGGLSSFLSNSRGVLDRGETESSVVSVFGLSFVLGFRLCML